MRDVLQYLVFALTSASIYSVAASGLVVTYTTSGIFNFAHGAIGMFAAFTYWELRVQMHLPAPIALILVLAFIAPAFGLIIERVLMRRLASASTITKIVVTVGLLVALLSAAAIIWPQDSVRTLPRFFGDSAVDLGGVVIPIHDLIVAGIAVAVAIGLRALLYGTRIGIAMRAVVDNRELTRLNGANPDRTSMASWALGSSLAALAGICIAPILQLGVVSLTLLVISAYAAAVVGRLRSLPLTFLGALVLGLAENYNLYATSKLFKSGYVHDFLNNIQPSVPVIMLFIVLLVLPRDRATHESPNVRNTIPMPTLARAVQAALVLVACAYSLTFVMSDHVMIAVGKGVGLSIVVLSLVPLVGYAGQISLAQLAFAGIGAYAMLRFGGGGNPLGLVAAVGAAAAVGALVALPALKLRDLYLALSTMAFALLLENTVFQNINGFLAGGQVVSRLKFFTSDRANFTLLAIAFGAVGVYVVYLRRGPFGRRLQAMKDSPAACATLGLDLTVTKLQVFTLAAAIAGLGGALFAGWKGQLGVGKDDFSLLQGSLPGLPLVLLAVVGGIMSVAGALIGGLTLAIMPLVGENVSSLHDVVTLIPGLIGISLGRNADGVMGQIIANLASTRERVDRIRGKTPMAASFSRRPPPVPVPEQVGQSLASRAAEIRALDYELGLELNECAGPAVVTP